jgi:hypothetical protein
LVAVNWCDPTQEPREVMASESLNFGSRRRRKSSAIEELGRVKVLDEPELSRLAGRVRPARADAPVLVKHQPVRHVLLDTTHCSTSGSRCPGTSQQFTHSRYFAAGDSYPARRPTRLRTHRGTTSAPRVRARSTPAVPLGSQAVTDRHHCSASALSQLGCEQTGLGGGGANLIAERSTTPR